MIHPFLTRFLYQICTLFHKLCKRLLSGILLRVFEIWIHNELVDIDSRYTTFYAFLHNIWWEAIRAVKDDLNSTFRLRLYLLQPKDLVS